MQPIKSDALLESKTLRESMIDHTDVLDKVKKLTMLPDDLHVTIEMAANYYEVHEDAIEEVIRNHREELSADGLRVLRGKELSGFKTETGFSSRAAALTIIPRRALLRIGMLLRDSAVARQVREYLLNVEEIARKDVPAVIDEATKLQLQKQRTEAMLLNAKTRAFKAVMKTINNAKLSSIAVELFGITALEQLTGKAIEYRPQIEKTYTATEIAKELGVTANKIGKIANAHSLKTAEYGITVLDKSPYSNKQVPAFRYNEKGRQKLLELFGRKSS
jgi:hypothetical protein